MISVGSYLKVVDNSGIKLVKCIKVLGVNKRKFGKPGDFSLMVFLHALNE